MSNPETETHPTFTLVDGTILMTYSPGGKFITNNEPHYGGIALPGILPGRYLQCEEVLHHNKKCFIDEKDHPYYISKYPALCGFNGYDIHGKPSPLCNLV